jgi:hypothetical protein
MGKFVIGGLAAFATVGAFVLGTGIANADCYTNCGSAGTSDGYFCTTNCD